MRDSSLVVPALLFALGTSQRAQASPLPNADLELSGDASAAPLAWTPNMWGSVVGTFTYISPGYDGAQAVRVDVSSAGAPDSGDAKWLSDPFTPDPGGGAYQISDWYRSDVPTHLLLNLSDGGGRSEWSSLASMAPTSTWAHAAGTVVLPPWVTVLRVAHVIDSVGWLETDSFAAGRSTNPTAPPLVSITFDDGWRSAYTDLIPKMDALHMRGTHFIISGFMSRAGYTDLYLTKREVVSLMARGHEVQSHTTMHQDLPTLSAGDLQDALVGSKNDLEALGGSPVTGLAFPFGDYTPVVRDVSAQHYLYARKLNGPTNVPPYATHELNSTVVTNTFTPSDLSELLDGAQAVGGWTILVFHRASEDAALDSFVKPEIFQQMLDLLVARGAVVKPVGEVLGIWSAPTTPPPEPLDDVTGDASMPSTIVVDDRRTNGDGGARTEGGHDPFPAPAGGLNDAAASGSADRQPDYLRPEAEVYESWRTPPHEQEYGESGCSHARNPPRAAWAQWLALVLLLGSRRRRRS